MEGLVGVLGTLRRIAADVTLSGNANPLRRALRHLPPLVTGRMSAEPPSIEVYQGLLQYCGHLGDVQDDFNVNGHVHAEWPLQRLTFRVNNGPAHPLSFRRTRRLAEYGDFNADIPLGMFMPGENKVALTATDITGASVTSEVTVMVFPMGSYFLPATICWNKVTELQKVGHSTDGKWLVGSAGIRTAHPGYDRVFLIGNRTWQDYEVTAPVTIHGTTSRSGPQSGQVKHVGFCLRWSGHSVGNEYFDDQPKWGLHPRGGIVWLTINNRRMPPVRQFYPGDSEDFQTFAPFAVNLGETFLMKGACKTLGPETTRYSFKVWHTDESEPADWDFEVVQNSATALRSGALALVAHELDATFGDVTVRKL